jgi:hypothetical protein
MWHATAHGVKSRKVDSGPAQLIPGISFSVGSARHNARLGVPGNQRRFSNIRIFRGERFVAVLIRSLRGEPDGTRRIVAIRNPGYRMRYNQRTCKMDDRIDTVIGNECFANA